MPTINLSIKRLTNVRALIDELHDHLAKYADVDDGHANDEMNLLCRLELLDYIFNERIK